jgi:hypothetical protein
MFQNQQYVLSQQINLIYSPTGSISVFWKAFRISLVTTMYIFLESTWGRIQTSTT